jgi:hypothetical protein
VATNARTGKHPITKCVGTAAASSLCSGRTEECAANARKRCAGVANALLRAADVVRFGGVPTRASVPHVTRRLVLATTRSGACPVVGQHSVDQELMELFFPASFSRESSPGHNRAIAAPACCGVVTRNRHTDEIRRFLIANGAPQEVTVLTMPKGRSKAEGCLAPWAAQGRLSGAPGADERPILLVDDTMAELVDPLVAKNQRIHKVLFVRVLL